MYMGPNSVGGKMERMKRDFAEAIASGNYDAAERKLLQDAIDSVEYIKGFFAGTSVLPKLTEDSNSDWGKTWEWLRGSFRNIDKAEQLINQPVNDLHLEIGGGNHLPGNEDIEGVDLTSGNPLKDLFDFDVPVFNPDPRAKEAADKWMSDFGKINPSQTGEIIDVDYVEVPTSEDDNAETYGMGM